MSVSFQTSDTEDFTEVTTLLTTGDIEADKLVQGYVFPMTVVPDGCLRYVRLYYNVTGTATAGTIVAGVTADRQRTINAGGSQ